MRMRIPPPRFPARINLKNPRRSGPRRAGSHNFGVFPRDPSVFAVVAVALIVVSAAASLIPGLRATHVDPIEALRTE